MPCSRIQRRRARTTSARHCSAARKLFFEADIMPIEEPPHRTAAADNPTFAHCRNDLIQQSNPAARQSAPAKGRCAPPTARCYPGRFGRNASSSFKRCIHLIAELALTSTHSAASRRDAPASTSRSTRMRKSSEQGFGIDPLQKSNQCR